VKGKGKTINWFGRTVVVILNGSNRGRPRTGRPKKDPAEPPAKPGMPGGRWTVREDQLVRTRTVAEVVAKTGRSVFAVRARRQKLGVSPHVKRWTVEEDLAVMRLSTKEAAATTGRSERMIHARRGYLGIRPPGANAGRAR
jgi:hypothetical protein